MQQVCHDGRHGDKRSQPGQTHPQAISTLRGLRGPRPPARTHACSRAAALAAPPREGPEPPGPRHQPAAVPPEGDDEGAVASPLRLAFSRARGRHSPQPARECLRLTVTGCIVLGIGEKNNPKWQAKHFWTENNDEHEQLARKGLAWEKKCK